MAGITNPAFRTLCREFGPGAIYVGEMVTTRALVERNEGSMRLIRHADGESPRSIQLYGVDPRTASEAVHVVATEGTSNHIDLNFGCPVPKVTRKGGGAALPWKIDRFSDIVTAVVKAAEPHGIPVTVKMRKGVDDDHLTYLDAGWAAVRAGASAVALHGRTAAEFYSGSADWECIARLRDELPPDIPVLGNGDIWTADDAVRMVQKTGCDGVVVGRGCLGRPWLFADLVTAFGGGEHHTGKHVSWRPNVAQVGAVLLRHLDLLIDHFDGEELRACRDIRKHVAWYFKGYPVGGALRSRLATVDTRDDLAALLSQLDPTLEHPGDAAEGPRGRTSPPKKPTLPYGWLDSQKLEGEGAALLAAAELSVSGG